MCLPGSCPSRASTPLALLCLLAAGCGGGAPHQEYAPVLGRTPAEGPEGRTLRLGVRPTDTARHLLLRHEQIIDQLNARLTGMRVRLESAQREGAYQAKLRSALIDFAVVEPQRVIALEDLGYEVIARAGVKDRISAVIVTRAADRVEHIRELRNRRFWFSQPESLASTMLVKVRLRYAGVHPGRQVQPVVGLAEESGLYALLAGVADAAGVSYHGWRQFTLEHPDAAQLLAARWRTDDLPGPAVMAHKRVSRADVRRFKTALLGLRESEEGRRALAAAGCSEFLHGESGSYDDMWEFLRTYRRVVGPLADDLRSEGSGL